MSITASASNLLPWSDIVSFSTAPICDDHAYIFAAVPWETFSLTSVFAVDVFEPVMVSPAWNTPVSELDLLITNLLFGMSSLRIVPVAFDVPPVMFSHF